GVLVPAALLAPPAPGDLAGETAVLSRLFPMRAQRTPSRQSPAWRTRRRLGRMTRPNTPEDNKSLKGNHKEPGSRQADRGLVCGSGPGWTEEQDHPALGQARHGAFSSQGPA